MSMNDQTISRLNALSDSIVQQAHEASQSLAQPPSIETVAEVINRYEAQFAPVSRKAALKARFASLLEVRKLARTGADKVAAAGRKVRHLVQAALESDLATKAGRIAVAVYGYVSGAVKVLSTWSFAKSVLLAYVSSRRGRKHIMAAARLASRYMGKAFAPIASLVRSTGKPGLWLSDTAFDLTEKASAKVQAVAAKPIAARTVHYALDLVAGWYTGVVVGKAIVAFIPEPYRGLVFSVWTLALLISMMVKTATSRIDGLDADLETLAQVKADLDAISEVKLHTPSDDVLELAETLGLLAEDAKVSLTKASLPSLPAKAVDVPKVTEHMVTSAMLNPELLADFTETAAEFLQDGAVDAALVYLSWMGFVPGKDDTRRKDVKGRLMNSQGKVVETRVQAQRRMDAEKRAVAMLAERAGAAHSA